MSTNGSSSFSGLSRPVKIALFGLASVVVFLFVLVILLATAQGGAAPAALTPGPTTSIGTGTPAASDQPQVIASSNQITVGGSLAVFGSNWTPGDTVTVFLRNPAAATEPILPIGSGQVTAQGTVALTLDYPTQLPWSALSQADVIVQAASTGAYAYTTLSIAPAPVTPTPTATIISVPPTATPTSTPVAPTATRTPVPVTYIPPTWTPRPITEWRGEYFGNATLSNAPVVVRNDPDVNFNWGRGAPANRLPADNFSARWTRQLTFAAQTYRFSVRADDGVRVWLDNVLIIDEWHIYADRLYTYDANLLAGPHLLRIEYYEASGDASIQFKIEQAPQTFADWKGVYWPNATLSGQPALTRNDVAVNFDWGKGAPADGLPADNFSARWTRSIKFDDAVYRFTVRADDGVRFFIDGLLLIDEWHDAAGRTYTRDVQLGAGNHTLRIDYYEHSGGASIAFSLQRAEDFTKWQGEYFANDHWGGLPALVRNDDRLNFDWGRGSPDSLIPPDRFSVRWTRSLDLDAGVYRFDILVDDGVRFYVDDNLVLDKVKEANNAQYSVQLNLAKGTHAFRIDYVEYTGEARITWTRTFIGGVTPTAHRYGYTAHADADEDAYSHAAAGVGDSRARTPEQQLAVPAWAESASIAALPAIRPCWSPPPTQTATMWRPSRTFRAMRWSRSTPSSVATRLTRRNTIGGITTATRIARWTLSRIRRSRRQRPRLRQLRLPPQRRLRYQRKQLHRRQPKLRRRRLKGGAGNTTLRLTYRAHPCWCGWIKHCNLIGAPDRLHRAYLSITSRCGGRAPLWRSRRSIGSQSRPIIACVFRSTVTGCTIKSGLTRWTRTNSR